LADVADPLADFLRLAEQIAAGHGCCTAAGRQQGRQHAQGRGFASPIGSQKAEDFAGLDAQVDTGHGFNRADSSAERATQAVRFDHDFVSSCSCLSTAA